MTMYVHVCDPGRVRAQMPRLSACLEERRQLNHTVDRLARAGLSYNEVLFDTMHIRLGQLRSRAF